ncbi:replication protein A 70 kDa DNA-binding subunit B [Tanacetum coccineum]
MVLQLAMMKMWDGKMCVQNGYHGTKFFFFDGSVPIVKKELFARHDIEKSENTSTRISTASKNSTNESFVSKIPPMIITKLLDVAHFRLQIRVQDESGIISLTLWNDEVQAVVDTCPYQLCDKYKKSEHKDMFPTEITALVGKKYAFKVSIDEYNVKKMLSIFTVLRLSGDPEIIESIHRLATPTKDTEATSSAVLVVL